MSNYTIFEERI